MATSSADDDYNPFTEEDIQKILKEEKSSSSEEGWSFVKKNELSEIWRKGESDKPVHLIKAFMSFPGIPPDKGGVPCLKCLFLYSFTLDLYYMLLRGLSAITGLD